MRILILGDTWGISPCHQWPQNPEVVKWFEYELARRGHQVQNRSWGGSANNFQLQICETQLAALADRPGQLPELIIWFHTELMRDITAAQAELLRTQAITLDQALDQAAEWIYGRVAKMRQQFPQVQWAVIGGHAPVRGTHVDLLRSAGIDYIRTNWRSEIAGLPIPESQAFEFLEQWKGSLWDYNVPEERIQQEQERAQIITKATQAVELFYNQKHPNWPAYHELADSIEQHFGGRV